MATNLEKRWQILLKRFSGDWYVSGAPKIRFDVAEIDSLEDVSLAREWLDAPLGTEPGEIDVDFTGIDRSHYTMDLLALLARRRLLVKVWSEAARRGELIRWKHFDFDAEKDRVLALERDLVRLLNVINAPPPAASAVVLPFTPRDPRDSDGWTEAVARDGVRPPSYEDGYLQSTHWQLLTAEHKRGRCARCRRERRTQLHHVTYDRLGCERPEDLREVCAICHVYEHARPFKRAA